MTSVNPIVLRSISAFSELGETECTRLAAHTSLVSVKRKTTILRQGEETQHVYFLLGGFVKVARGGNHGVNQHGNERRGEERQEIALAILGPGNMLGELSALTEHRRSASIVALCDCSLVKIEHEAFLDCLHRNPSIAINVMRYMAQRLIEANRQVELLRSSTEARITGMLRQFKAIGLPVELYPTNAELARMVGASREMVSRVISQVNPTLATYKKPPNGQDISQDSNP